MPQFRAPPRNRSEWKVGIDGRRTHLAIGFERSSLVGIGAFNGPMRPPDGVAERGFREVFWRGVGSVWASAAFDLNPF